MDLVLRLSRIALFAIALVLGSLGVFCLYWSCVGVPLAVYALVFLGTATAIILAAGNEGRAGG